jgi:protein ImuB
LELLITCQPQKLRLHAGLYEASASANHLRELVQMQLERIELPGPLTAIRLTVLLSARLLARQRKLFGDDQDRRRQLAAFIDRTSCRVPLSRAVLVADAQPEHAVRYEPFIDRGRPAKGKLPKIPYRPLLLEAQPVLVETIGAVQGPPMQFRFRGRQHRTLRSWGPERIQTGWWRGRYIRRDYYRVETAGGRYWLFKAGGKWFLHGIFD